jgi:hypothetical protein
MKILLDFKAKLGREDIFITIIGNESLHEPCTHNGRRVLNFAISKSLIFKAQHLKTATFINTLRLLMISHIIRYIMS